MGNRSSSSTATGTDDLPPDGARPRSAFQTVQQSQSYYSMLKEGYQSLVNAIIRPPRSQYDVAQLGPIQFPFCDKVFHRRDFELVNDRNLRICCSQWSPVDQDRPSNILPCVVYMHGNSSSRLEALGSLSLVLSIGATLLTFDFAGSGMSEGEYVSLGVFEKDDLQVSSAYLSTASHNSCRYYTSDPSSVRHRASAIGGEDVHDRSVGQKHGGCHRSVTRGEGPVHCGFSTGLSLR
jgi:hypothetical protein